eukprot:gene8249-10137_t
MSKYNRYISIELDSINGKLILSNDSTHVEDVSGKKIRIPIAHPATCPFLGLEKSNSLVLKDLQVVPKYPPVKVGVSILIEDRYHRFFLTKRSSKLRIFPDFWLAPGGHMEVNETFVETGIREVFEETGIHLNKSQVKIVGAFESAYPIYLSDDKLPVDHHIVIFMHAYINDQDIDSDSINLQPSEVSLAAWVPRSILAQILIDQMKEFEVTPHNYIFKEMDSNIEIHYPKGVGNNTNNYSTLSNHHFKQLFIEGKEYLAA